jgi:hypothetical protein
MKGKPIIEYFADIKSVPSDPQPQDAPKVVSATSNTDTEENVIAPPVVETPTMMPSEQSTDPNLSMCMRDCLSIMNTNTLINIGLVAIIFVLIVIINKMSK